MEKKAGNGGEGELFSSSQAAAEGMRNLPYYWLYAKPSESKPGLSAASGEHAQHHLQHHDSLLEQLNQAGQNLHLNPGSNGDLVDIMAQLQQQDAQQLQDAIEGCRSEPNPQLQHILIESQFDNVGMEVSFLEDSLDGNASADMAKRCGRGIMGTYYYQLGIDNAYNASVANDRMSDIHLKGGGGSSLNNVYGSHIVSSKGVPSEFASALPPRRKSAAVLTSSEGAPEASFVDMPKKPVSSEAVAASGAPRSADAGPGRRSGKKKGKKKEGRSILLFSALRFIETAS
ncbi:hypothetical protein COCNU_15G005260 [Cocos nucifera]|uniref:Uncharacterized protein n=1 Tax=Cocos nucifera TaxID=13894 RepID=A0A8K0IX76_COCNU|nr:hypothetical protein COCNU_15G005260 [Cocos nucifera]